jgi:hypothetical protein
MKEARVSELKAHLSAYLSAVRRGEASIGRIPLSRLLLARAALPMAVAVKTLDAIHLASALRLAEVRRRPVLFVTHDAKQALAARTLGLSCAGI